MVAALIGELAKLRNQVKEKVKDSASSLKCIRTLYNTMNPPYHSQNIINRGFQERLEQEAPSYRTKHAPVERTLAAAVDVSLP
jgi:hypothetical protein